MAKTRVPVNLRYVLTKTGCRSGKIVYSTAFSSWGVFAGDNGIAWSLFDGPSDKAKIENDPDTGRPTWILPAGEQPGEWARVQEVPAEENGGTP